MKESNDTKIKSYIWIYWTVWAFITLLTMYLKCIYFKGKGMVIFNLLVSYALVIWIPIMILNVYEFYRLVNYIKKTYPVESENMINISGGIGISKRTLLPFVYKKSLDDAMLRQLGNNYKKFYMFVRVVFVSIMFVAIFLLYL